VSPAVSQYERYHIDVDPAPNVADHPSRFRVRVNRLQLASLLVTELFHFKGNLQIVMSRPCMYGVFSGPVGGFMPRPQNCVGCLRCTVQYPDIVRIEPNPARMKLGDSYVTPEIVDTLLYETSTGRLPVRGAGYRGPCGGPGWDGMWTDMSEIVRPTRDGIHGREFISTQVDLGEKPHFLVFDRGGRVSGESPRVVSLPLPFLFDAPPLSAESEPLWKGIVKAADTLQTLVVAPVRAALAYQLDSPSVVPMVRGSEVSSIAQLPCPPRIIELEGWDEAAHAALRSRYPEALVCVRIPYPEDIVALARRGLRYFHLVADYHGRASGSFVREAIRKAHDALVTAGLREQVTLVGSGGIVAAEHVPKAILCGLDAVALDISVVIALQGRLVGEAVDRGTARVEMPSFDPAWAAQRITNLCAAWRDQLLEILGAMGMREVRRLRGEVGRAMFQADLEREAFAGIEGFEG